MESNSINIGGNFEGNMITSSTVHGDVLAAINKLPASTNPEKPGIKELLTQLETEIKDEPNLDEKSRVKALKQVESLAKASEISPNGSNIEQADNAITMLKGVFSGLQSGTTLILEWNKLLPILSPLLGIG